MSIEDVQRIQETLLSDVADKVLFGKDVMKKAEEMKLAEKMTAESELSAQDIKYVLHAFAATPQQNIAAILPLDLVKRHAYAERHSERMFQRTFYEYDNGIPMPSVILTEDLPSTKCESFREYGANYVSKRKILPALSYRAMKGNAIDMTAHDPNDMGDDDDDDDSGNHHDDDSHHGTSAQSNSIKQWNKGLNQLLYQGLGDAYTFDYNKKNYVYEECFVRSLPLLLGRRLRRIGYITDSKGSYVAKIADTSTVTKMFGNYDSAVDIYDATLADDTAFGQLLCLFSQFLTHKRQYMSYRLDHMLTKGPAIEA